MAGAHGASPPDIVGPVSIPVIPPSVESFLAWAPQPIPVIPAIAVLLAVAYLIGLLRVRKQHRPWPVLRAVSFLAGCGVLFLVTGTGIEGYGMRMFSVFVFQQMTLMMLVPPLLIMGSPGRLLLRAVPRSGAGSWVLRAGIWGLRSRISRVALHPVLVLPLLATMLFGIYLTGAADLLLRSWVGHLSLEIAFLLVGIILATPLVSTDPLPLRVSYPARAVDTFLEMQAHAAFGLVLTLASAPLIPFFAAVPPGWGVDPMIDQWWAGGMAWVYGEVPVIVILIATLVRWSRQEARRAPAAQAREDQELAAYNRHLQSLGFDPSMKPTAEEKERTF